MGELQEQLHLKDCRNFSITAHFTNHFPGSSTQKTEFRTETYLNGSLESLLNIQPLAHYCLVQLPFKSQEIHVGLRLWDQFPDLCVRKKMYSV